MVPTGRVGDGERRLDPDELVDDTRLPVQRDRLCAQLVHVVAETGVAADASSSPSAQRTKPGVAVNAAHASTRALVTSPVSPCWLRAAVSQPEPSRARPVNHQYQPSEPAMCCAVSASPEVVAASNTARRLPMFEVMACSQLLLIHPSQGRHAAERQIAVVAGVRSPDACGVARCRQPVTAVLDQRLQHPAAHVPVAVGILDGDERLVGQAGHELGDIVGADCVVGADDAGGGEVASTGEDRQAVEDSTLVVEQQVVAPVDDRSQGLLAGAGGASAAVQQAEPIVEADRELGQGHRAQP